MKRILRFEKEVEYSRLRIHDNLFIGIFESSGCTHVRAQIRGTHSIWTTTCPAEVHVEYRFVLVAGQPKAIETARYLQLVDEQ
jgi:hypothetical protein